MSVIHKCDRCNKVVKDSQKKINFMAFERNECKNFGLPDNFCLCESCLKEFAKKFSSYFKNFK